MDVLSDVVKPPRSAPRIDRPQLLHGAGCLTDHPSRSLSRRHSPVDLPRSADRSLALWTQERHQRLVKPIFWLLCWSAPVAALLRHACSLIDSLSLLISSQEPPSG